MTHLNPIAASTQVQAHMAELHASALAAKAASTATAAVTDPDHDGDSDSGAGDSGGRTDVKA